LLIGTLAIGLTACGSGPGGAGPDDTQEQIQKHLPSLIDSTLESPDFLETNEAWNNLGASFGALDQVMAAFPGASDDDGGDDGFGDGGGDDFGDAGGDEGPSGQEIADMLVADLFNESNYLGGGIYTIPGSLVCPDIEEFDEQSPDGFSTVADQECLDGLTDLELRIHVQSAGDGLDITLLVGPAKARPIVFELRSDRITLASDLAEVKIAVEHLATLAAAEDEDIELPETMEGVVALSLIKHAAKDISIELAIRSDLKVEGSLPELGNLRFSTAAAEPLVAVRLNGNAETVTAALDLHRTQVSMPWAAFDELSNADGTLAVDFQGLSATVEFGNQASDSLFTVRNIGLGDAQSTVKLDDATLLAIDLNAASGRHFDLVMEAIPAQGLPSFRFLEEFKLEVLTDLTPLAAAGDDVGASLLDQTYTFEVQDGMQPVEGVDSAGLMAVGGEIRIGSTVASANVVVAPGQCLLPSPIEIGEHELIGALSAGPCPQ
jgi:hypothetical protein